MGRNIHKKEVSLFEGKITGLYENLYKGHFKINMLNLMNNTGLKDPKIRTNKHVWNMAKERPCLFGTFEKINRKISKVKKMFFWDIWKRRRKKYQKFYQVKKLFL